MKSWTLALSSSALLLSVAHAETQRQHDTHEHGAAKLQVAIEQNILTIALESPSYNLLGFGHAPQNEEQSKSFAKAIAALESNALFTIVGAQCKRQSIVIDQPFESALEHEHEEQGEEHEDEHKGEHDEHHEGESEAQTHSEFNATWHYACDQANAIGTISTELFTHFPLLEDIDVSYLSDTAQGAAELNPSAHSWSMR